MGVQKAITKVKFKAMIRALFHKDLRILPIKKSHNPTNTILPIVSLCIGLQLKLFQNKFVTLNFDHKNDITNILYLRALLCFCLWNSTQIKTSLADRTTDP